MKKTLILLILVILIIVGLGFGIYKFNLDNKNTPFENNIQANSHDGTYFIDGKEITLKNGLSEIEIAPGSASKIITRYFGNDIKYDFNKDGRDDSVFILTQETGGSGKFYYLVARLDILNGPIGFQGLFLGDRIAPQTTEITKEGVIIVNYADRKPNESFTVPPSIGKSLWLILDLEIMQFLKISNADEKIDLIRLDTPRPNQIIKSPVTITGKARGTWFFEASFPVFLTDWDGRIIAQGIAQAKSDWMTTDFVPFEATLTFTLDKNIYSNRGSLILKKDNPSGLPEHDDALEIPIMLAE